MNNPIYMRTNHRNDLNEFIRELLFQVKIQTMTDAEIGSWVRAHPFIYMRMGREHECGNGGAEMSKPNPLNIKTNDPRPARGLWAPGEYLSMCAECRGLFIGDKRAMRCANCEYGSDPQPKLSYGLEDWEKLVDTPEDALERLIDDMSGYGDQITDVLNRIEWPVEVLVYKPMDVTRYANRIAERALDYALEMLDEEHSDPDGDATKPTQAMKEAAKAFAEAVVHGYVSWVCEPTGDKVTFALEQAREMFGVKGNQ